MDFTVVNLGVTFAILAVMSAISLSAMASNEPKSLDFRKYPSVTWAFTFFATVWCCTFIVYVALVLFKNVPPDSPLWTALGLFDNVAKVLLLATAIAYSSGREFNVKKTAAWLGALLIVLMLWTIVGDMIGRVYPRNIFVAAMQIAPDLVISSIAIVAVGWVFFVRWGGPAGWLFLLTTIAYAILQFPAAFKIGLSAFLRPEDVRNLDVAFSCLAGGKILIAFGFILLIWNPKLRGLDVRAPKRWLPAKSVKMPKRMYQWIGWPLSGAASIVTSALSDPLKSYIAALLKSVTH